MLFWLIIGAMTLTIAAILLRTLFAPDSADVHSSAFDISVYRDQLQDVERDQARGVLSADDAERARIEISRRILALDKAQTVTTGTDGGRIAPLIAGIGTAVVLASGIAGYLWLGAPGYGDMARSDRLAFAETTYETRPTQTEAEQRLAAFEKPAPEVSAEFLDLMSKLRQAVADNPDDLQGQRLLARNEAALGNFVAAHRAQAKVLELQSDQSTADDLAAHAELLTLAAGGYVSPEAEAGFSAALTKDPENGSAVYYLGLMMLQIGRPDIAFQRWQPLFERSPADAPWMAALRTQLPEAAQLAGISYTPELSIPGPSASDIDAAANMSPQDRRAMIDGMVSRLSDRLARDGGTSQEWARLIAALGVLDRVDQAQTIWQEAKQVFANDPQALADIEAGAKQAGLIE